MMQWRPERRVPTWVLLAIAAAFAACLFVPTDQGHGLRFKYGAIGKSVCFTLAGVFGGIGLLRLFLRELPKWYQSSKTLRRIRAWWKDVRQGGSDSESRGPMA